MVVSQAYTKESKKDESYVIFMLIVVSTPPTHTECSLVPFFLCLNS